MTYGADRTTNRNILVAIIVLIILGYAFFQARKVVSGPQVNFLFPENGATFEENLVDIKGRTKNINTITFNDGPIFIDENGYFNEKFLLSPGYNIVEVEAKDRFGKTTRKTLEIMYQPKVTETPLPQSTSSPASAPQTSI